MHRVTAHLPSLLTPREVSSLLKIPESTLAIWRSTGRVELRFLKIGRAVRYQAADTETFLTQEAPTA